jgi:hypothetical protein
LEDGSQQHGAFSAGDILSVSSVFLFGSFFFHFMDFNR